MLVFLLPNVANLNVSYIDHAKRSVYRAANNIMGKIGRIASE